MDCVRKVVGEALLLSMSLSVSSTCSSVLGHTASLGSLTRISSLACSTGYVYYTKEKILRQRLGERWTRARSFALRSPFDTEILLLSVA